MILVGLKEFLGTVPNGDGVDIVFFRNNQGVFTEALRHSFVKSEGIKEYEFSFERPLPVGEYRVEFERKPKF